MMDATSIQTHTFESMGSIVELILVGGSRRAAAVVFARAEALADEWEWTFSRFLPGSELSRLNASAEPFHASRKLFAAVVAALNAARATDGLFDPTILPVLLSLGYDRSYSQILAAGSDVSGSIVTPVAAVSRRWQDIVLDESRRIISLPECVQIDLGGIAKGLYADYLSDELSGWPGGAISAGGDMRLWGISPDGDRWIVGVEDPRHPDENIAWLELANGGIATSGTNRRRWQRAGRAVHHLIDPRTARSVEGDLLAVTAVAETAAEAEIAATAMFVMGRMPDDSSCLASALTLAAGVDRGGQLHMHYPRTKGHSHATEHRAA